MKIVTLVCALFTSVALAQTPAIKGLANNYSYTLPGLPNYGIAQGSIFVIFGSGLATTSTGLQSAPLQTTLNGVSVNVTVNGTAKQAMLYYVTPTQVAAVLPSSVPAGTGQITVSNNGATSAPAQIVVVQSAFGILTLNNGTGPAAAFDAKYATLGASNAANPGDTVLLWGTGAGPVQDDSRQSAVTTPLEILVGGASARIVYQGRSQYPGLDQLNFVVPPGVSGCYVSVVVKTGNIVSNYSSIPVAASGRTCSDLTTGPGPSVGQIQSLAGKTTISSAVIGLSKTNINTPAIVVNGITISPAARYALDSGFAYFQRVTLPQQYDPYVYSGGSNRVTSVGSCSVYTYTADANSTRQPATPDPGTPVPAVTTVNLNAGPVINVTGPAGKKTIAFQNGGYAAELGGGIGPTALPEFIPTGGGVFTFDNGAGGPDVGSFSVQLNFNPVVWSNMPGGSTTINRSQGTTLTWTGGDAGSYVSIVGGSATANGGQYVYGSFYCTAPAAAHQFTVPAAVLLALPSTSTTTLGGIPLASLGSLGVTSYTLSTNVNIPGFDLAYAYASSGASSAVTYQ